MGVEAGRSRNRVADLRRRLSVLSGGGSGEVALLAASPDGYKELGRFTLPKQSTHRKPSGKIWTHPVVSDGRLYLRDQELVFCYKVKAP